MGIKGLVKQVFVNKSNTKYEEELADRRTSYEEWISLREGSAPEVSGGELADYMFICAPYGKVSERAFALAADYFSKNPEAQVVYGDEDVLADGKRSHPCFRPQWSPDLFDEKFYFGGFAAVRKSLMERANRFILNNDFSSCEKELMHTLLMQAVQLAGGYEKGKGRNTICHIPEILFHARSEEEREEWTRYLTEKPEEMLGRNLLSIVIPSKDNCKLLERCIDGVVRTLTHDEDGNTVTPALRFEIIVVDNGSAEMEKKSIQYMLRDVRMDQVPGMTQVLYIYEPMPFNFSMMCNMGIRKASGDLILFLNDDVELKVAGTIEKMARLALRPYTGAVGLKLLYPESKAERKIQHAGIVQLPMGPVHKLQFLSDNESYYFGYNRGLHNAMAVTGACLMVEAKKFQEAHGFWEELAVAFNDVDLCYRLYELGYENVCCCDLWAYHDESYTRGADESGEKMKRLLNEREKLQRRHPALLEQIGVSGDPYYSVHLNREGLDTQIRYGYETMKNKPQEIVSKETAKTAPKSVVMELSDDSAFADYRTDPCLMVQVESILHADVQKADSKNPGPQLLIGWSVVLGDNNGCYDKTLILQAADKTCYTVEAKWQYRPDLEENMADQTNVALSGFWFSFAEDALPKGEYRIGVAAKSRVGNIRLINFSNRSIQF